MKNIIKLHYRSLNAETRQAIVKQLQEYGNIDSSLKYDGDGSDLSVEMLMIK